MSNATTNRHIDLTALSWPATQSWDGTQATIEAPDAPDDATLQAEVDAAPTVDNTDASQAATKLAELRSKGWANLTNAEKADLVRLFFTAGA